MENCGLSLRNAAPYGFLLVGVYPTFCSSGNTAKYLDTGEPIVFDASALYAHDGRRLHHSVFLRQPLGLMPNTSRRY